MSKCEELAKEVHRLYNECKNIMGVKNFFEQSEVLEALHDENVKQFYITITDFFLQQVQKEMIKNKKY